MNKATCIIIEDEPLALLRTQEFVEKVPFLDLLTTFDNALEGLAFLKNSKVDILFLDINMDELTGVELLESTKIDSQVIFTTAYQEYAIKGYELNVTDYLLKPFTFNRFLQAVDKAHDNLKKVKASTADYFFVKTENRLEKVNFGDIIFIEGMRDYRRIHLKERSIMTLQNFKDLEIIIPNDIIIRIHKSYMVALAKIESIEKNRIKIGDKRIPISDTYKTVFYQKIKNGL